MKPIAEGERRVINIHEAEFEPFFTDRGKTDGYFL
jgi:hypothetical protein